MIDPIENLAFNAFDRRYDPAWQNTIAKFDTDRGKVESMTRDLINSSFKHLRSAEAAFDLLNRFQSLKSGGTINRSVTEKFADILLQFNREIDSTREVFEANHANPPRTWNQPTVAGLFDIYINIQKRYCYLNGSLVYLFACWSL